ncbi:hypothetical protein [Streptomyces rubiginosohelvolus]|uniref:hypothetical protein n=1 Tax=Streptomyces rubiginosohelvolus TaxID=67362 RepID=UPI003867130F|nr:hypothetical protein OG475_34400 [Streptomyces rubiginosohelvolus]
MYPSRASTEGCWTWQICSTSHTASCGQAARETHLAAHINGEAVIWHNGTVDFGAVQAHAASALNRAGALADRLPSTYAAFDVLAHPDHGGDALAARPYTESAGRSWSTSWPTSARRCNPSWPPRTGTPRSSGYETLQPQGVEGYALASRPATPLLVDCRTTLDPEPWRAAGWTIHQLGRPGK